MAQCRNRCCLRVQSPRDNIQIIYLQVADSQKKIVKAVTQVTQRRIYRCCSHRMIHNAHVASRRSKSASIPILDSPRSRRHAWKHRTERRVCCAEAWRKLHVRSRPKRRKSPSHGQPAGRRKALGKATREILAAELAKAERVAKLARIANTTNRSENGPVRYLRVSPLVVASRTSTAVPGGGKT